MDLSLSLPWRNRCAPYVALHIKHWGWSLGRGRHRQIFTVGLMWGRFFMDPKWGGSRFWYPEIPWPRDRCEPQSHLQEK